MRNSRGVWKRTHEVSPAFPVLINATRAKNNGTTTHRRYAMGRHRPPSPWSPSQSSLHRSSLVHQSQLRSDTRRQSNKCRFM